MKSSIWKIFGFLVLTVVLYNWIGYAITDLSGGKKDMSGAVEISPEGGETLYWGKGRCYTCHSLGGQGSAVRGPNHGQFGEKFPMPMGSRATERAIERTEKTGTPFTAVDYIVESMAEPGAYVVNGYKNEMAVVYAPPISLNLNEIKAIVAYLMVQGGDLDMEAIDTAPSEISTKLYSKIQAAQAAGGGDPGAGETVFEDNCEECHSLEGEMIVGPDLSTIGDKGIKFISESILNPAKSITPGFETYEVETKDGTKIVGLKTRDEGGEVDITKKNGDVVTVVQSDIKTISVDANASVMPEDLNEAMTVKDFQDLQAYMIMQKAEKKDGE
ncbi:MAG: c-type cytochrome [Rhodospirillaceae bacterium]|nr:c-type cytochrome [Rhodospirillaceae bacterium]MBL6940935.1 c-type cytochrome [Rhodospirillales bacterium]